LRQVVFLLHCWESSERLTAGRLEVCRITSPQAMLKANGTQQPVLLPATYGGFVNSQTAGTLHDVSLDGAMAVVDRPSPITVTIA
jgi:hypothetical protein